MPTEYVLLLAGAVGLIAFLYSAVGHAGASGYIAVMSLFSVSPTAIKPTARWRSISSSHASGAGSSGEQGIFHGTTGTSATVGGNTFHTFSNGVTGAATGLGGTLFHGFSAPGVEDEKPDEDEELSLPDSGEPDMELPNLGGLDDDSDEE